MNSGITAQILLDTAFAKLEASEFKVYYRFVQIMDDRYQAFERIEDITTSCKFKSRTTTIAAIESLVQMSMVRRLGKRCKGYIYELLPPEDWQDRPEKESTKSGFKKTKSGFKRAKALLNQAFDAISQKINDTKLGQPDSCPTPPVKGGRAESVAAALQFGNKKNGEASNPTDNSFEQTDPSKKPPHFFQAEPRTKSENCTNPADQKVEEPEIVQEFPKIQESPKPEIIEPTFSHFEDKLQRLREMGISWAGKYWQGAQMIISVMGECLSESEFMQRSLSSFIENLGLKPRPLA